MRVLAIETSSPRGSIALLDGGSVVAAATHDQPNAHAEQILPLIERLFAETGSSRNSLDRIGAGIGPGSFTGLRMGIALAIGLGLGLDRPVVGVSSLRAMARGVPLELPGPRCAVLDARRDELFVAVYDERSCELFAAAALGRERFFATLFGPQPALKLDPGQPWIVVGALGNELVASRPGLASHRAPETDLPHAIWVGALASELDAAQNPPEPIYVRGAGATLPSLPPSPLSD